MRSPKGKRIINYSSHIPLLIIVESVSVAPVKQAQEMKALLFVVGKLLPRSLRDGHGKLPDEKWFEPILETYNLKVERKIDAKKLRAIIAQKLSYIRRRAKVQREPWYK